MKNAYEANNESVYVTMSASDLCEVLKAQFNAGYALEEAVTGNNITWEASGYVNKGAIKYIIKPANSAIAEETPAEEVPAE